LYSSLDIRTAACEEASEAALESALYQYGFMLLGWLRSFLCFFPLHLGRLRLGYLHQKCALVYLRRYIFN